MIIPCIDDTEGPWLHAVDWPIGDSGGVANADGESSIVGSDNVEVEAGATGDVEPAVLAGVVGLVLLTRQVGLCNRKISWLPGGVVVMWRAGGGSDSSNWYNRSG